MSLTYFTNSKKKPKNSNNNLNAIVWNPNGIALGYKAKKVIYPIQNKVQNKNHAKEIALNSIIKTFPKRHKFWKLSEDKQIEMMREHIVEYAINYNYPPTTWTTDDTLMILGTVYTNNNAKSLIKLIKTARYPNKIPLLISSNNRRSNN